ncbi:Tn3 family transposase [Streptomyces sp. P17]|uniref:Tn3 family transposase n=1 Tax=Streptomyces sp. P17 TaxID=3074716 RepID=UPI0028F44889|nr:Tn3 family transposase [Streptomyces sp. P17]MDT9697957.1 Tn3 family transposase [Streptomyces sp. P17]
MLAPRERNKTITCLAGAEPVAGAGMSGLQRLQFFLSESPRGVSRSPTGTLTCRVEQSEPRNVGPKGLVGGQSEYAGNDDPDHQEKTIKFNELLANCLIFHTAVDITKVANDLIDEGWEAVDLATVTPYITSKTRRFGTWHLDMEPPENEAVGRLRMAA